MNHHVQLRFSMVSMVCALLVAAIVSFASPSRAAAQNCNCEFYTIKVDPNVICNVTVCVLDPAGNVHCVTVLPGGSRVINCVPGGTIGFRTCTGFVPFTPSPVCHLGIGAGPNCCTVDACLDNSVDCPIINIRPSILDVCPCP